MKSIYKTIDNYPKDEWGLLIKADYLKYKKEKKEKFIKNKKLKNDLKKFYDMQVEEKKH